jgi:hypothetical protein
MQSWADYITGTHESSFWKPQLLIRRQILWFGVADALLVGWFGVIHQTSYGE